MTSSSRNPNLELYAVESARPPAPDVDELVGPRPSWWWTGRPPQVCAGRRVDGSLSSLPMPDLAQVTREQAVAYFDNAWTLTELLFSALQGEAAFRRPPYHRLRHPMIFYYAHPAAFYVNKLRVAGLIAGPLDEELETLFQAGVDEMSWDDLSQSETDWPSVRPVAEYRRGVYRLVRGVFENHADLAEGHRPIDEQSPLWALFMGMEHERIHLELSSVLVRELPVVLVRRPDQWPADASLGARPRSDAPLEGRDYPANRLQRVDGSAVMVGKPREWPSYGWDNEYGERHVHVSPFVVSKHLISNGETHAFVVDGGYQDRRFWTDEGWRWRTYRNAKWPTFWVATGAAGLHQYRLRGLFEVTEMPWDWPAIVNAHEARAYCAWFAERQGAVPYRLLTEAEHHALRDARVSTASGLPDGATHNHALAFGSEGPVDAFEAARSGAHDVFGNVWQWIEDDFHPLHGFRIHPYYDDFSTPCFDGKHEMVMGSSFMSTGDLAGTYARYHFRPHFFQHAGFRVARSDDEDPTCDAVRLAGGGATAAPSNVYETVDLRDQYVVLHYGSVDDAMPWWFGPRDAAQFPRRCAELVIELCEREEVTTRRALDVGCGVGGAAFELARRFHEVQGVDLSASFVRTAQDMQRDGHIAFRRHDEGDLGVELDVALDPAIDRARVKFRQADACALPSELVGFDAVLLANLLCRVPSPRAALERMGGPRGLVRRGGLLVVTSPYTWSESFTPKEVWLGGVIRDGRAFASIDGLAAALGPEFELVEEREMPLVIREHARKFQFIVAQATAWRRSKL